VIEAKGKLNEADMGFIKDTNSLIYLKRVNQSVHSHNTIDEQFKDTDKQLLDLLKELL